MFSSWWRITTVPQNKSTPNTDTGDDSERAFRAVLFQSYHQKLDRLATLVRAAGYETKVFSKEKPSIFPSFGIEKQNEILKTLDQTYAVYQSAIDKGVESRDDRKMAWWAMRHLGLRPHSDTFSKIEQHDVIEIYDANHKQIFRTFNFFPCLSYSLDEIHTYEWRELYERDEKVGAPMFDTVIQVLTTQPPAIILQPFETHWVQERFSEGRNKAELYSRLVSPLMMVQSDQIAGYVNVFRVLELKKFNHNV